MKKAFMKLMLLTTLTVNFLVPVYAEDYIDMTHSSFINNKNITEILPDGVHPSLEAHKIMGEEIAKKIQYIVK